MDFFGQQDAARRQSTWLVLYFSLGVLFIVATIHGVAALGLFYMQQDQKGAPALPDILLNPELAGYTVGGTLAVILLGSLFKIIQLRGGGRSVARAMGAVQVYPDTRDRYERRLINVVEEMAIASGTPVPDVYLMRDEPGINAFAAGYSTGDAVVAVTQGTMTRLSREELQGVVAHEFSHILNGDMRLNIRLMGVLHGILLIALLGEIILRSGARGSGRGRGVVLLAALALLVIGYLGVLFGRLIKAAVSRKREYLADAAAVQFTRNPDGIAGALKKIGGFSQGSELERPNAEFASHLFFARGLSRSIFGAFATHPPLEERIRRIDPNWDAEYTDLPDSYVHSADDDGPTSAFAGAIPEAPADPADAAAEVTLSPDAAVTQAGAPAQAHFDFARTLLLTLPDAVLEAVHKPDGAQAVAYSLIVSNDMESWQTHLGLLQQHAGAEALKAMDRVFKPVAGLDRRCHLPLIVLCTATLRSLPEDQQQVFRTTLEALILADQSVSPFEFALQRVLRHQMHWHNRRGPWADGGDRSIGSLKREAAQLLSALAHVGHDDPAEVDAAYHAGVRELGVKSLPEQTPAREIDFAEVGKALDRLEHLAPLDKKRLIAACTATVAMDGKVTLEEGEILRAVCDSLDVPMPPFLADGKPAGPMVAA